MTEEQMTDYAPYFAAAAAAQEACKVARSEAKRIEYEICRAATAEAETSLHAVGVKVGETLLTRRERWEYQSKPILIRFVTCWRSPVRLVMTPGWLIEAHYAYARKDGQMNRARNVEDAAIRCEHPAEFGAALLKRFPLWGQS